MDTSIQAALLEEKKARKALKRTAPNLGMVVPPSSDPVMILGLYHVFYLCFNQMIQYPIII
jgi:hypothetical protein